MKNQEQLPYIQDLDYTRLLQQQDFFPKIFLIPSEIKLDPKEGIKVIKRTIQRPDKYEEERIQDIIFDNQKMSSLKKENEAIDIPGHGLLSLFKRTNQRRIKLAICICVYSEPKFMLKNTIKGIQKSYKHFYEKAGILPHEIIITVIYDGIQKINNSNDQTQNMISFFEEIDLKNGFAKKLNGKSLDEYLTELQQEKFNLNKLHEEEIANFTLFTSEEIEQLQAKLFKYQYQEYIRIQQLLTEVHHLKKKKDIRLDFIPLQIYKKYEEICKDFCVEQNLYFDTQQEIQEYLDNKKNIKTKLIFRAISQTQILCERYLDSRQDKVILYPVRLQTDDFINPLVNSEDEQLQKLNKKKQYNYMFLAVKYQNQGKLSSHMLFFQGFCKLFDPEYCMLTDVGMKPHDTAIYKMWEYMELNQKCGGVCGYMNVKIENGSDDLGYRTDGFEKNEVGCLTRFTECLFSIQRAQQFQYHYAHMLDKSFEAFFSYIHVLPGAFSAYRWKALKSIPYKQRQLYYDDENLTDRQFSDLESELGQDETLMKRYLKAALVRGSQISLQDSNMYLAEDRIMCLGIHALGYDIKYMPNVESDIDPVTSLTRLLGQRRRWINGSWFAFNYVRKHHYQRTSFIFLIQIIYYTLVQALSWIGPGIFYITMNLTLIAAVREYVVPIFLDFFNISNDYNLAEYSLGLFNLKSVIESIPDIINYVYIMLMFSVLLYSLMVNNNNTKFKQIYYSASTALGIYGIIVIILLAYNTYLIFFIFEVNESSQVGEQQFIIPIIYLRAIILFIILGHGLPILWSLNLRKYCQCIVSLPAYIFYVPSYINLLQIFAFCRIDDLSWGTKGIDSNEKEILDMEERILRKQWERRKYIFVLQYISTNVVLSFVIIKICEYDIPRNIVILASMILVAFLLLFRIVPALIYLVIYSCKLICGEKLSSEYVKQNSNKGKQVLNILKQIESKLREKQKMRVKKKKQEEYRQAAIITSKLLPKSLNTYGNILRSRVTQHMINNNLLSKRDMSGKKPKKRINLRKKLRIVEEASMENSESYGEEYKGNYDVHVGGNSIRDSQTIKKRLKQLKLKKDYKKLDQI